MAKKTRFTKVSERNLMNQLKPLILLVSFKIENGEFLFSMSNIFVTDLSLGSSAQVRSWKWSWKEKVVTINYFYFALGITI